jgi:GNAT superfamily N-acetyltransferase
MPVTFEHLPQPTDDDLARIQDIYESNFPPVMQKPFAVIAGGSRDGSVIVLVARDEGQPGRIVGIATLAYLPGTPTLYLGYLAVDQRLHNRGIGGQLFRFTVAFVTDHTSVETLVWEVEAPEPGDPAHIHNRRIRFYERLGAQVVTLASTYRMPDGNPGSGTIPLRLMWYPLGGRTTPPLKPEVASWIKDIYDLVYPGSEALAAQLIAELDDDIR